MPLPESVLRAAPVNNGPVLVLGGASLDTIVHLDTLPEPVPQTLWPRRSYRTLGSTGAGKALNLVELGHRVVFHTLLGSDPEGEAVRAQLAHPNVTLLTEVTAEATEQHVNLMTPKGERISLFVQPPADPDAIDWAPVQAALSTASLVVANILAYVKPALPWLVEAGVPVWTDLHDYDGANPYHQPFIDAADVIFLSSDNLRDYRQTMEELMAQGKALVVCTHGRNGATALTAEGTWLEQPALPVAEVVDTNGAGDAFFSGFVHGVRRGASLAACLRMAAYCGARCVTSTGLAAPGLAAGVQSEGAGGGAG